MAAKSVSSSLKFIVPSAFGIAMFILPVPAPDGGQTMLSSLLVDWIKSTAGEYLIPFLVVFTVCSAVLTLWHHVHPIAFIAERAGLSAMFSVTAFWLAVRLVGAAMMVLVYLGIGPEILTSEDTGGNILSSVVPACAPWYLVGGMFLPFLTDYGLVDLFSAVFRIFLYRIFVV